jgi:tellurite resistance protein TehA-like permease
MSTGAGRQVRYGGRAAKAVRDLHPGYFAFVMATGIISTAAFLLGPSWLSRALLAAASAGLVTWWIPLLVILGSWRHVRRHWPLTYEPTLWSMVFPLGMYSVATLTFGKVAHLPFMEPLARFMLWVTVAAWALVAAAFLARLARRRRETALETTAVPGAGLHNR